jgi:hypothetical protein
MGPHRCLADVPAPANDDLDRRQVPWRPVGRQPFHCNPPPSAILGLHVGHVLRVRPEEQVIRVAAARFVAAMANEEAFADRAMLGDPGQPVGAEHLPTDVQLAVAKSIGRSAPEVAARSRVDLGVEGKPLLGRPVLGTLVSKRNRGRHAPRLRAAHLAHLIWAMALCVPEANACDSAGPMPMMGGWRRRLSTGFTGGSAP